MEFPRTSPWQTFAGSRNRVISWRQPKSLPATTTIYIWYSIIHMSYIIRAYWVWVLFCHNWVKYNKAKCIEGIVGFRAGVPKRLISRGFKVDRCHSTLNKAYKNVTNVTISESSQDHRMLKLPFTSRLISWRFMER